MYYILFIGKTSNKTEGVHYQVFNDLREAKITAKTVRLLTNSHKVKLVRGNSKNFSEWVNSKLSERLKLIMEEEQKLA